MSYCGAGSAYSLREHKKQLKESITADTESHYEACSSQNGHVFVAPTVHSSLVTQRLVQGVLLASHRNRFRLDSKSPASSYVRSSSA
jgi:hypothetical protein